MQVMAQNIPSLGYNQAGNVFATFQGYPTSFDIISKSWKQLSPHGPCCIELSSPPAIFLKHITNGKRFHIIQLKDGFQHVMQNKEAVLLTTSNDMSAETFGFGFVGDETAKSFESALFRLGQYYKQTPAYIQTPVADEAGALGQKQNVAGGHQPEVRKRTPMNVNAAYRDPDQVNELIAQHGNKDHEEENLCTTLSKAIEAGDIKKSQDIVAQLIKQKIKVTASPMIGQSKINILIQVESRDTCLTDHITLPVDPDTMTVRDLKDEVCRKYDFPRAIQKFIIKDRLAKDNETLYKCGVKATEKIYLYLKALDDTVQTKEVQTDPVAIPVYQNQFQQQAQVQNREQYPGFLPRGFSHQQSVPQRQGAPRPDFVQRQDFVQQPHLPQQGLPPRHFPKRGFPSHGTPLQPGFPIGQAEFPIGERPNIQFPEVSQVFQRPNEMNLNASPESTARSNSECDALDLSLAEFEGWNCSVCTFRNLPTFDVCTACDAGRPGDNKPPLNYKTLPVEVNTNESVRCVERDYWVCPACTLKNLPTVRVCTVCAEPRDYHVSQDVPYEILPGPDEIIGIAADEEPLTLSLLSC